MSSGPPDAAHRHGLGAARLSRLVADGELRHVGRKRSGRERVHSHLLLRKLRREDAGQVMHRGLRGGIGPCGFRLRHVAHDRTHVDDGRRPVARRRSDQHRGQIARQREKPGHVDAEHAVPRLPGEGFERSAPVRPGVVDQNVQHVGALAGLGGQRGDAGFVGDRAPETLAGPERGKLLRRRLASLRLARGDQDARAGAEQRLGADPAKTGRPAGHQRGAARERKKARLRRSWLPA